MRVVVALVAVLLAAGCQSREERQAAHAERALEFFEAEQWSEAKIEYLNLLRLDPEDADASYHLAEAQFKLGEFGDALWRYREAVRIKPGDSEWQTKLAAMLLLAGRADEARTHIEAVLALQPDHAQAVFLRARIHGIEDELDLMLERIDESITLALDSDDEQVRRLLSAAYTLKARTYAQREDFESVEQALRDYAKATDSAESHLLLAAFLVDRGRVEEARAEYRESIDKADSQVARTNARLAMAGFFVIAKQGDDAEKVLLEAREEDPEDERLLTQLARFYFENDRADDAARVLEQAAAQRPDQAAPLLVLTSFHSMVGDRDEALQSVDRALVLEPENERALVMRAELLMDSRDQDAARADEARAILAAVLEANPSSLVGLTTRAKFLMLAGEFEEAANVLRRVAQDQPSSAVHLMLATAYESMEQTDLARSELLRSLQLDENNQAARRMLAQHYLRAGNRQLAIQEADAALRRHPEDPGMLLLRTQALLGLERRLEAKATLDGWDFSKDSTTVLQQLAASTLYMQLGQAEQSRALISSALERDPTSTQALRQLVALDTLGGDPLAAVARINEAITEAPERAELYEIRAALRMGFRSNKDGSRVYIDDVKADLHSAIERDPKRASPHLLLGRILIEQGDRPGAEKEFVQAIELDPEAAIAYLYLAQLLEADGRKAEARQAYERLLEADPEHAEGKNNLAWLLADAENATPADLDRAQQLAQDAKEARPDSAAIADTLGYVMLKRNIPRAAIALFREAIGNSANEFMRATARYHLALAYEQAGEADRAISELELAIAESETFPERANAQQVLDRLRAG